MSNETSSPGCLQENNALVLAFFGYWSYETTVGPRWYNQREWNRWNCRRELQLLHRCDWDWVCGNEGEQQVVNWIGVAREEIGTEKDCRAVDSEIEQRREQMRASRTEDLDGYSYRAI